MNVSEQINALKKQKEALDRRIIELSEKNKKENIVSIIALMQQYNISLEDLKKALPRTRRASILLPKYRCPVTGATWTGQGRKPKWVVQHLTSGGNLDDFLIK